MGVEEVYSRSRVVHYVMEGSGRMRAIFLRTL